MMGLFSLREKYRFSRPEIIVTCIYAVLLAWNIAHHQPWADEAQAWLLGRDLSLTELFGKYLHYEGSPGLWHFILWGLCRLHVSYVGMHWIAGGVALLGVAAFLRYAPFPAIVRFMLPFSFYFFYQYAVVARSYVLAPICVFAICALAKKPAERLWLLALLLGLLANICLHASMLSVGFSIAILLRMIRQAREEKASLPIPRLCGACGLLIAMMLFAAWSAFPPKDLFNTVPVVSVDPLQQTSAASTSGASAAQPQKLGLQEKLHEYLKAAELVRYGLSNYMALAIGFHCVFMGYLFHRRRILDILPLLFLDLFYALAVASPWHYGLALIAMLGALWINFYDEQDRSPRNAWVTALTACLVIVFLEQYVWSAKAMGVETFDAYCGDQAAARFLQEHGAGKRIAGFQYWTTGIQPWFGRNPFINQPLNGFWHWSKYVPIDDRVQETLAQHPDMIVLSTAVNEYENTSLKRFRPVVSNWVSPLERMILNSGAYVETKRFCGTEYAGAQFAEGLCQVILEPSAAVARASGDKRRLLGRSMQ
jgi:hypothetical protein